MIISQLIGGLGNQMFEYAAGFVAASHHQTAYKLDNLYYQDHSKRFHRFCYRPYGLELFNISAKIATPDEIKLFTYPRVHNKYLFHLLRRFHKDKNVVNEHDIKTYNDLINVPSNCYLRGFYQKYEFFKDALPSLKKEFTFKEALPATHNKIVSLIENAHEPICVVFRRGDYVGHPTLDIVNLDFYYEGLRYIVNTRQTDRQTDVFVFSDDIEWCKHSFKPAQYKTTFVDQRFTGPLGGFYLQLMMKCSHFIIPNSTYPYWAALLAPYKDKIVVAPRIWYKGQPETTINSILPPHWIAL